YASLRFPCRSRTPLYHRMKIVPVGQEGSYAVGLSSYSDNGGKLSCTGPDKTPKQLNLGLFSSLLPTKQGIIVLSPSLKCNSKVGVAQSLPDMPPILVPFVRLLVNPPLSHTVSAVQNQSSYIPNEASRMSL